MHRSLFAFVLAMAALAQAHAGDPRILVLGDSLSAAYGIPLERGWVNLLQARLKTEGYGYEVVNASVSGDTTGAALTRLPRALELHQPAIVIVELGGNDGLRGTPVAQMQRNLASIIEKARAVDAEVLVTGVMIPPNYGAEYTARFSAVYTSLVDEFEVALVPFILDGIALEPSLMQADGIHPTAAAQPRILDNVWPALQPLLSR
ncbi:MAG: arylesterase [Chromatiales bacterium]|jgi:acyl-CoA thioesterase-1|nr:arylesterase [Chromatiales bacterium]MDH3930723.1 arylesterase [Chromatiales bacterium]MDH4013261.1 arylesterase [Chromatiales bacterium]PLX56289.1 MAG: arylesterase [Chromatiales bacterium]